MSVQAITWAYQQKEISAGAKFLLVTLANYSDHKGTSWPGQERLARDLSATSRSIRNWTMELVEKGLITTTNRAGEGKGRLTIIYQLQAWQPENGSGITEEATGKPFRGQPENGSRQPENGSANTKDNLKLDTKDSMSGKPDYAKQVIEYLNQKTGKKFKPVPSNLKLINARLGEGHTLEDIFSVVDRKTQEWISDQTMAQYLRPSTLFNAEKFNQYIGEVGLPIPQKTMKPKYICTPEEVARQYQDVFGKPPPAGKSTDEVRQIISQRREKTAAWYDA